VNVTRKEGNMEEEKQEQRRQWRERQQRSRKNRVAAEAEKEFDELKRRDPIAARVQEIMAQIALEPRRPVVLRNQPPIPAELPSLTFLVKEIERMQAAHPTEARRLGLERCRAAMTTGAVSVEDFEQLRQRALDKFGHCSAEAIIAVGGVTEFPRQVVHDE